MNPQVKSASVVVCLVYLTIQLSQASQQENIESALKLLNQLKETRHGLSALKRVVTDIDDDMRNEQKRTCVIGGGMSKHCSAALLNNKINMLGFLKSGGSPGKRSVKEGEQVKTSKESMKLERKRFDPCALSGGSAGYACFLKGLAQQTKAQSWLGSDHLSPGKRSFSRSLPVGPMQNPNDVESSLNWYHSSLSDLSRKRKGLQMLQRILEEMENDLIYEQKRTCQFNLGGHCATESAANVADHWHYLNSPLSPGRKRRDTSLYKKLVSGKLFQ